MVSTTQRIGEAVEEPTETAEADAAVSDEFRDPQEVIDLSTEAEQADAPTPSKNKKQKDHTTGPFLPAHTVVTQDIEVVGGHSPRQRIERQQRLAGPFGGHNGRCTAAPSRGLCHRRRGGGHPRDSFARTSVVVMSIGPQVQVAKIVPMGDHAAIQSMNTQSQYPGRVFHFTARQSLPKVQPAFMSQVA